VSANPLANYYGIAYFKQKWNADAWAPITGVTPQRCLRGCAPIGQTADFHYDFGKIKRENTTVASIDPPRDLLDWYAKIQIYDPNGSFAPEDHWHGIIPRSTILRKGGITSVDSGYQSFQAVGLEHLLDRVFIDRSHAAEMTMVGGNMAYKYLEVHYIPSFNERYMKGYKVRGNRSESPGPDGVYVFEEAPWSKVWNNRNIVEYLLNYFKPTGPKWSLTGQVDALEQIEEVHSSVHEIKTLWDWLNILIDRRRGLGFSVLPSDGDREFVIDVFTLVDKPVTVGPRTIPPNQRQQPFIIPSVFAETHLVDPIEFVKTSAHIYDEIEVIGRRALGLTTISNRDFSMVIDASFTIRDDYIKDTEENRLADKYDGCMSTFKLDPTWDWKTDFIVGKQSMDTLLLSFDDDGRVVKNEVAPWKAHARIQRSIPLKKGWDYSKDPPEKVNDDAEDSGFLPIQVYGKLPPDTVQAGQWRLIEKLSEGGTMLPNCHVRTLDNKPGFRIHATPEHIFYRDDWPKDNAGKYKDVQHIPRMEWSEELAATVAIRLDQRLRVLVKSNAGLGEKRRLVIEVPTAEYWYATKATVVDVKNGQLVRIPDSAQVLRNDVDVLQGVAAFAKGWYATIRQNVKLKLKRIYNYTDVGVLLTSIQGQYNEPVNTIVSSVATDFTTHTIEYGTGWGAFDVVGELIEDKKGMASRRATEMMMEDTLD
jgi:hypothetical protein